MCVCSTPCTNLLGYCNYTISNSNLHILAMQKVSYLFEKKTTTNSFSPILRISLIAGPPNRVDLSIVFKLFHSIVFFFIIIILSTESVPHSTRSLSSMIVQILVYSFAHRTEFTCTHSTSFFSKSQSLDHQALHITSFSLCN